MVYQLKFVHFQGMGLVNHERTQVKIHVLATEGLHELRLVLVNKEETLSSVVIVSVKGGGTFLEVHVSCLEMYCTTVTNFSEADSCSIYYLFE